MSLKDSIKDVIASIIGSTACVYTGQPFDTVKVRMQVQPEEFTGPIQCFRKTFQGEGWSSLWKGSLPALSGALGENMVAFGVNGHIQRLFNQWEKKWVSPELENVLSGSLTGFCTAFVLCPADVLKCRAQLNRAQGGSGNVSDIMNVVVKESGLKGFYRGFGIQIARDIPFYAFFFGSYDFSCKLFKKYTDVSDTTAYFISGGLAGQAAWVASLPFDTVKSVIQTTANPKSVLDTTKDIVARYGVRGLYSGIEVAVIRAFPANAALFCAYELSRSLMTW
mgnify:CR=1 FL=1